MSKSNHRAGHNQQNQIDFNIEEIESKRAHWRKRYHERMEFRCTLTNENGLLIKCRKSCATCSYYWSKKSNKVSLDTLQEEYGIEFASDIESPMEYTLRKEKEEILNNAINSLPSEDLKIVTRMFGDNYSFKEIGNDLGISKTAAFKKWQKAKVLLKEKLEPYLEILLDY